MTVVDTRPPLILTPSEAKNWFSLHSEDIGREVIIREWKPAPCPEEYLDAWEGLGMWQAGVSGGEWPIRTLFARDVLERPPYFMTVHHGYVEIHGALSHVAYSLHIPVPDLLVQSVQQAGLDSYVGTLTGMIV